MKTSLGIFHYQEINLLHKQLKTLFQSASTEENCLVLGFNGASHAISINTNYI